MLERGGRRGGLYEVVEMKGSDIEVEMEHRERMKKKGVLEWMEIQHKRKT